MADAEPDELVIESNDGVSVEKSFEPDDFPVPAIAFSIRSERDGEVSLRLVDTIPEDVPPEDIGFHPEYGAEFWETDGDTIVFSRDFEPREEFTTVYGLRDKDVDDIQRFLTEPRLESVVPAGEPEDSGEVVRDVIDDASGPDEDPVGDDLESAVTQVEAADVDLDSDEESTDLDIDLPEPDAEGEVGPEADSANESGDTAASGTEEVSEESSGAPAVTEDSLVASLAAELRSGEVADEDVEALEDALGVSEEGSTEARIEHLQSQVADLEAYTDALEAFLDEEGDAQTVIRELREEFDEATERLDDVDAEIDELWTAIDEAVAEAADVAEEAETIREDVEELESEVDGEVAGRVDDLVTKVEGLEDELSGVKELRDRLTTALSGLAPRDPDDGPEAEGDDSGDGIKDDPEIDLED